MQIQYLTTKSVREVSEVAGAALIARKIARAYETRQLTPEPAIEVDEISPRTGKPKRVYKRRDMQAED